MSNEGCRQPSLNKTGITSLRRFHFAHSFQLLEISRRSLRARHFDDVIVNAIFIVTFHAGDDAPDCFNAHPRLDVIAQVVQQQDALLVVTDLFSTS